MEDVLGLAACALLPWYFPQNLTLARSLAGVFGGPDTASAFTQVALHGRPWLAAGIAGLLLTLGSAFMAPGRAQGRVLMAGYCHGSHSQVQISILFCEFQLAQQPLAKYNWHGALQ